MNWIRYGYMSGVRSIERACRESIKTFEAELIRAEAQRQQLRNDDGYSREFIDHIGDVAFGAEQSIKAVREAFLVVLYHYWEVQACYHLNLKKYEYDKVYKKAAERSPYFSIDQDGIERLRLIVNTIKHGADGLIKIAPELFDTSRIPQNQPNESEVGPEAFHYRNAFRLSAADLDAAFTAVRVSGPSRVYPDDEEEEVDLSKAELERQ